MNSSEYLKRIQNLSLIKRKIIFWAIIIIFGLVLFTFYIMNVQNKIKNFPTEKALEELKLPELKKEVEKLPKSEMEKEVEKIKGDIGEIEKLIKEAEKTKNKN